MTRRRFFATPSAFNFEHQRVSLASEEARHLRDVLRLAKGDEVYVFDGAGREFHCVVSRTERDFAELDLGKEVEPARPESPINLTLAVALLKGEKFDLVVQKAVELGVTRVVPVVSTRADVRIRNADEAKRKAERWQRIALESAKQCGRARLMEIDAPDTFDSLISGVMRDDELRLMFAERDGASLTGLKASLPTRPAQVIALVGSEGGWTDDE